MRIRVEERYDKVGPSDQLESTNAAAKHASFSITTYYRYGGRVLTFDNTMSPRRAF